MAETPTPGSDDPLTDPLAQTVASSGTGSPLEKKRLHANVKAALFGDGEPVRIGRYRLIDKLGQGGMGVVYRAHDDDLDRDVAIKLLRPDGGGTGTRLLREARSMARLSHPNIAAVYDVGTHEESVYIAMEFVDGPSLREWLSGARTFDEIRDMMLQAAAGLSAAHEAGVVHRDFKPDNVIVGTDGRVRVLDFGLAKLARTELGESSDAPLTRSGSMLGTPRYMAPEQLRQKAAGPEADQFAFCVALYEAVYGGLPFEGDVFAEMAASVLTKAPKPPAEDDSVPSALWPVLERGLAREAGDRFESMKALAEALAGVGSGAAKVVSRPALRDAREDAREQLAGAFAESLIDADELDERLERLENAKSPDTVGKLVEDLQPAAALVPVAPAQHPAPAGGGSNLPAVIDRPATSKITAIFSGTKRNGAWIPAQHNKVTAVFGGIELDFRDVEFPPGVTEIEVQAVFGGVELYVPPGVRVEVETNAILGGVELQEPVEPPERDAPVIRLTGFCLFSGIEVHERMAGEGWLAAWKRRRATRKARRQALRESKRGYKQLPPGDS